MAESPGARRQRKVVRRQRRVGEIEKSATTTLVAIGPELGSGSEHRVARRPLLEQVDQRAGLEAREA
jgi:hypothetical protein